MKCPNCHTDHDETARFCSRCGEGLRRFCPACGAPNPHAYRYCGKCGAELAARDCAEEQDRRFSGERKQVTVLFCKVAGYDAVSEALEPEEIRRVMNRLFERMADAIRFYGGTIEKLLVDTMMAVFGAPRVHEDDPVRAIRAGIRIHALAESMNPLFEGRTGRPLVMKSGISTGLVLTGREALPGFGDSITGDTVNLASRLMDLAGKGEILIGPGTHRLARAGFKVEARAPVKVKGKKRPVPHYRVVSALSAPFGRKGMAAGQAPLTGRKAEMARLTSAFERLLSGRGSILCIGGDAGTGKSRLLREFQSALGPGTFRWIEGHAYSYAGHIPYFPMTDLLNRAWGIAEEDPVERVRERILAKTRELGLEEDGVSPLVESLYSIVSPETERMDPEGWKRGAQAAIRKVIGAMAGKGPAVFVLEDIHWADPSSLELLRAIISGFGTSALLICTYRPPFHLFTGHEAAGLGSLYQEIRLSDLSPSDAHDMLASLLGTETVPPELILAIQHKTEGNPFYLEETVHNLAESGVLSRRSGAWRLTRPIRDTDIPPTLKGLIAARLDRLEPPAKRVLQEASVIGRIFSLEILRRISRLGEQVERRVRELERSDLLRTRSVEPDLEFVFKHALTRDVGYEGLLIAERREIHERVAAVMERAFEGRLTEFCETLAYHYARGNSRTRATDYLIRSGEKALKRYALEEAHAYFKEAMALLEEGGPATDGEARVSLLNKWAFAFYYGGNFRGLLQLLTTYRKTADSLPDGNVKGMFLAWMGCALWHRERFTESRDCLKGALKLGKTLRDSNVEAYARAWLTWPCTELGLTEEAVSHGEKAQALFASGGVDAYAGFNSLAGLGYALWHRGDRARTLEAGRRLIGTGRRRGNPRSEVLGHCCVGWSHMISGDLTAATACFDRAAAASADPWYRQFPSLAMCYAHISGSRPAEAEKRIAEILAYSRQCGAEFLEGPARFFNGVARAAGGDIDEGASLMEAQLQTWRDNGCRLRYAECAFIAARTYLTAPQDPARSSRRGTPGRDPKALFDRAKALLTEAVEMLEEMGCRSVLASGVQLLEKGF